MKMNGKTAAAAMSAVALVSASAIPLAAVAAPAATADTDIPAAAQAAEHSAAADDIVRADAVEGTFSFDQAMVTSNDQLASVFAKAAATLCQTLPHYTCDEVAAKLAISANGNPVMLATAQELAAQDGDGGFVMACACATNGPGGGAVANAAVEGASVASLAALAGAA